LANAVDPTRAAALIASAGLFLKSRAGRGKRIRCMNHVSRVGPEVRRLSA